MLVDLHQDIAYYFLTHIAPQPFGQDAEGRQSDLPKLKRAGADLVAAAVFPFLNTYRGWSPNLEMALDGIKVYYAIAEEYDVKIVESRGDLLHPGLKFLLLLEGADVLRSAEDLRLFYRLGIRALGITWNLDNRWGRSCMSKGDGGLTEDGAELVERAQQLGVVVDLAHAGAQTTLDVLKVAKRPVIISHANAAALRRHPRNVDDSVLKALRDNGGVIGLTFIPATISETPTARDLAKHAAYIREKFGVEIVAIGTDYLGVSRTPEGLESVDKIAALEAALREAGFRAEEIEAVFWRNALRVLREALP